MFAKLANPGFLSDIRPLLSAEEAEKLTADATNKQFTAVFKQVIAVIPGDPWARTPQMLERFSLSP